MTQRTSAWSLFDAGSLASYPDVTSPVVKIIANRRQVDKRFSVLGFTIDTGGLPYFEVLLTTDRTLFDPAQASKRMSTNFYASRQDVGLQRATDGSAVWLAPTAIVRGFANAGRVYYTAIAYLDVRGTGPVLAQPVTELRDGAPFVSLSPDLASAQGLSTLLGVPLHRLARLAAAATSSVVAPEMDAADDAAEGEDGYGVAAMLERDDIGEDQDEEEERALAAAFADADDIEDDDDSEYTRQAEGLEHNTADSERDDGGEIREERDDDYDDGFDGPVVRRGGEDARMAAPTGAPLTRRGYHDEADDAAPVPSARSMGATYPAGAPVPDMLTDDEDQEDTAGESGSDRAYDDYEGGTSNGMEALALDAPPEFESLEAAPRNAARPLEIADMRDIVHLVAPYESGGQGYAAINADGEYEGAFGRDHPAYHRWHVGLSYGLVQFTQDSGSLGRLLSAMRDRDAAQFRAVFGASADELVRVTNLAGPPSSEVAGGRSVRVQPVGGADLWMAPWRARFERAAQHVPFQAAQNQLSAESYLEPMLPFARWLGLDTQRALAIVFDRAVQMGVGGARRWLIEAVGPVPTSAQRQAALSALGQVDLVSFQRATAGLDADGEWGPLTHAAMVAALRALGDRSPIPIPTRDQMLDAIERRASATPWAKRVRELRRVTSITDEPFTF